MSDVTEEQNLAWLHALPLKIRIMHCRVFGKLWFKNISKPDCDRLAREEIIRTYPEAAVIMDEVRKETK